ncbi:splicing factor 1 isoform X5 [Scleropages formosus]|uniref:RNA binding motif protein 4.1 n=1 Tax=Scleropages formosus TaxID=113540 RepID=A0A8D0CN02_SCLFO|nr:splicing factor 1 isoform X5 [Scleropages formosus]
MVKIFIGNLSQETTAEELRALFTQYGKVSECDIVKNYGFVHMDEKTEADEAIRNLHHYELHGQPMNVEISRGKAKASTKLHVGNINSTCTNQELRAKFEEYGPVVECDIVKDYAFVHMERVEDAMEAIKGLDNTAFQGKLMSVKLSTSRLRTAPGMGERTGCYRCGQEGHWSKECPMDQNGSFGEGPMGPGANGFGPPRFGGGGRGRGFHRGFSGDPGFSGSYGPAQGFARGGGFGGGGPGYGRGMGYDGTVSYGPPGAYNFGGDRSAMQTYGNEAVYGNSASYGAVPAYPMRHAGYEERDPYGVVDFYEKYRARPYGANYYEERRGSALPIPSPIPPATGAIARDRISTSNLDPFEQRPPPTSAPASSYYTRDRSPIRRVPPAAEGFSYERSRLSPVSRSGAYDVTRARDPYDQSRYGY